MRGSSVCEQQTHGLFGCLLLFDVKLERNETIKQRSVRRLRHPFTVLCCHLLAAVQPARTHARTHARTRSSGSQSGYSYTKSGLPAYLLGCDVTEAKILQTDAHSARFVKVASGLRQARQRAAMATSEVQTGCRLPACPCACLLAGSAGLCGPRRHGVDYTMV